MTNYLRDDGRTLLDVEITDGDLRVVVNVRNYSECLLEKIPSHRLEFIEDIGDASEMRGWYHEWTPKTDETPQEFVAAKLKLLAKKHNLQYATD